MTLTRRPAAVALTALAVLLIAYPQVASQFWVVSIAIKSLWLGIVALSLIFLAGYGGMVSLAQTAVYGTTGYAVANLTVLHGWGSWQAVGVGILAAVAMAIVIGLITVRSHGIYFLMLTLAIGVFLYYFALQYRPLTQGHAGLQGVVIPDLFGVALSDPTTFYYAALAVAVLLYLLVRHVVRSPFGIVLQGIRDDRVRMAALGYNVALHRVAAFALAGLIAAFGGVLAIWYNGGISPGSIDVTRAIDVLVVAVIGGLYRLEGAFIGAGVVTLLSNFASDYTERYNTLIGATFIVILLLSPGGVVGIGIGLYRFARRTLDERRSNGPGGPQVSVGEGRTKPQAGV